MKNIAKSFWVYLLDWKKIGMKQVKTFQRKLFFATWLFWRI